MNSNNAEIDVEREFDADGEGNSFHREEDSGQVMQEQEEMVVENTNAQPGSNHLPSTSGPRRSTRNLNYTVEENESSDDEGQKVEVT